MHIHALPRAPTRARAAMNISPCSRWNLNPIAPDCVSPPPPPLLHQHLSISSLFSGVLGIPTPACKPVPTTGHPFAELLQPSAEPRAGSLRPLPTAARGAAGRTFSARAPCSRAVPAAPRLHSPHLLSLSSAPRPTQGELQRGCLVSCSARMGARASPAAPTACLPGTPEPPR